MSCVMTAVAMTGENVLIIGMVGYSVSGKIFGDQAWIDQTRISQLNKKSNMFFPFQQSRPPSIQQINIIVMIMSMTWEAAIDLAKINDGYNQSRFRTTIFV